MGDLLMSLPVLRSIRTELPETQISLFLREELKPLLAGHPDVHEILTLSPQAGKGWRESFRLARRLRRLRFDAVLVLNPTKLFHTASFLSGIPIRLGYQRKWGFLLSRSIPDTKQMRHLHEVEYNLEIARLLGIPALQREIQLPSSPPLHSEALRLLESTGLSSPERPIAIHPWTSNPAKGWPMEHFLETARQLHSKEMGVILLGEPEAGAIFQEAAPGIVDLCRRIPLRLLPEVLRLCGLLISNDSGPVHVAAAVGTPTLVVAPRGHAEQLERWRPLGDPHRILIAPEVADVVNATREILLASTRR